VSESSPTSLETTDFQQIMKGNILALDAPLPTLASQIKFFRWLERLSPVPNHGGSINNRLAIFGINGGLDAPLPLNRRHGERRISQDAWARQ
jgi:hypothetical protein